MSALLLRGVELEGRVVDVRCRDGLVVEVGPGLRSGPDEEVLEGSGGAVLPGLFDHHVHLLAMAAAAASLDLGPTAVAVPVGLDREIRAAVADGQAGGWLRAAGYHEAWGGPLDRDRLDRLTGPDRPLRVKHRTGHAWILNTAGCIAVREPENRSGWFVGRDDWLRERLPPAPPPDLAPVGDRLVRLGVTGVTDATPTGDRGHLVVLAGAVTSGALPLRVRVTGGLALAGLPRPPGTERGPVKLMVLDDDGADLGGLIEAVASAHRGGAAVAIHAVSELGAVVAVAAWAQAGVLAGDRLEHGSVLPDALTGFLAAQGVTVVTQPGFVQERGDYYLGNVDPDDLGVLYRCRSLLDAGVAVAGSTDAPFGPDDPWLAMRAAVDRRTRLGAVVGAGEALTPGEALGLFLGHPDRPGGPSRAVEPRAAADLCLLDCPLVTALDELDASHVAATVVAGRVVHRRS